MLKKSRSTRFAHFFTASGEKSHGKIGWKISNLGENSETLTFATFNINFANFAEPGGFSQAFEISAG